ncbi:uncharacterized protein LOC144914786 [Branchiostoma floridae x Branchiostoma belcheri]
MFVLLLMSAVTVTAATYTDTTLPWCPYSDYWVGTLFPGCPSNPLQYCWRSEAQRCSRVYRVQTNSAGARDLCARDEARLVTIHTATARRLIESLICGDSWIGLATNRKSL